MQLAVNVQIPAAFGGLGAQVLYIGEPGDVGMWQLWWVLACKQQGQHGKSAHAERWGSMSSQLVLQMLAGPQQTSSQLCQRPEAKDVFRLSLGGCWL